MIIKLKDNETGYDVVEKYIRRFWKYNGLVDTVIFQIGLSYDGVKYEIQNEIASPCCYNNIEFLYDWWEGEQYIKLIGICCLSEVMPYSGLYNENGTLITCDTCINKGKYASCTLDQFTVCWEYEE